MKIFGYYIEGEEENTSIICAEDWESFAELFCVQEEIHLAAFQANETVTEHLSGYHEWRFFVVDDTNVKNISAAVIPHIKE